MKSISSALVEKIIYIMPGKHILSDPQLFEKNLEEILEKGEVPYHINYKGFSVDIKKGSIDGMDYYILNCEHRENKNIIMYFHGGAYVHQPNPFHWMFLNKIAHDTKSEIWVPIYPKVPFHNAEDAYGSLIKLYNEFLECSVNNEIIFMGDSAGGGLVLGMAQKIRDMKLREPKELIMISPWLDVSMTLPGIDEREQNDSMLGSYGLRMYGEMWAGIKDLKDPMVSPLYGDLNNLGKITIFTGTYDILNTDAHALLKKSEECGIKIEFHEKEFMGHIYPLWPIKEARETIKEIEDILDKNSIS